MAEHGLAVPFERVRPLIGMGGDKLLPQTIGVSKDSEAGRRIDERRGRLFMERYLPQLRALPGARDLLLRMRQDGLRLVIASSASEQEVEQLLKIAGVEDIVRLKTSSGDADQSKPAPDIVQAALEQANLAPDGAVMVGDTPYDIEAARKAGIATIALRSGGWKDEELTGAIAIYDDPADFLAHYDHSPLGHRA